MGKRCTDFGNVDERTRWLCAAAAAAWLATACGGGGGGGSRDSTATAAAASTSAVVKLTDHGANCNGTFDNAAALASAIAAAKVAGLPVQLPSAVCAYGSVIRLDGVKLQGTGSNSVLYALDGTQSAILLSGDGAEVHDLTLSGSVTSTRQAAFESTRITALGARNFVINGVTIAGASAAGIQVANAASAGRITNNHIADTLSDSVHLSDEASGILIEGNVIERAGDDGISVVSYRADGGLSHDITARSNTVRNNLGGRAMSIVGGSNILYESNVLQNSGAYACLYIAQESAFSTYGVRNVVARNNTMTNCGSLATGHGAIMVGDDGDDSNDGVSLIDNTIVQSGQAGIRVYGSLNLNVLLSGNRISGRAARTRPAEPGGHGLALSRVWRCATAPASQRRPGHHRCMTPLSVLDLSPIVEGGDAARALRSSLDLAQHAEAWGYRRYWVAEHHNMDGVASSATAVLIGHLASGTRTIRVGSGGVMLPNHAPLVIAEQFGTLATLHPGRIDLGLGRAPGTDRLTAHALRRTLSGADEDSFPQDVMELIGYLGEGTANQGIRAIPGIGTNVPVWLLGSSLYSAQLAAHLGLPFAFASHFAPDLLLQAANIYRAGYRPSKAWPEPHLMVGVNVVCADTEEEAQRLFTSIQLRFLGMQRGQRGPLPRPIDPAQLEQMWSPPEKAGVQRMLAASACGTPATVRRQLDAIIDATGAHELIVAGAMHDHAARLRSYELLATLA